MIEYAHAIYTTVLWFLLFRYVLFVRMFFRCKATESIILKGTDYGI